MVSAHPTMSKANPTTSKPPGLAYEREYAAARCREAPLDVLVAGTTTSRVLLLLLLLLELLRPLGRFRDAHRQQDPHKHKHHGQELILCKAHQSFACWMPPVRLYQHTLDSIQYQRD